MQFPDVFSILLPLLKVTKDNKGFNTERAIRFIGSHFELSMEEKEMVFVAEDGSEVKMLREAVRWGRDILRGAGLLEGTSTDFQITRLGKEVLKIKMDVLTWEILKKIDAFREYEAHFTVQIKTGLVPFNKYVLAYNKKKEKSQILAQKKQQPDTVLPKTNFEIVLALEDQIEKSFMELEKNLEKNLLAKVKNLSASAFEELAVLLLAKICNDKNENVAKCLGKTGDGGVDGVVMQRTGLKDRKIYIQAKCWKDTTVGRPEVQKFIGALELKKSSDGIFITTSKFTAEARGYAEDIINNYHVTLIDGEDLVAKMIEHGIGVQAIKTYEVKSIDSEFFSIRKRK